MQTSSPSNGVAIHNPWCENRPDDSGEGLLRPFGPETNCLDIDLFQRYALTARLLDRMLRQADKPVRILELGANYLNPLPRFIQPERMRLTRCDVQPFSHDSDFVLIAKDQPLPFADDTFDAVVALEVLEHLPHDRRRDFTADCLRVARHGAVFSAPNGVPEVIEAEQLAAASFKLRQGREHPYLREHQEFGLPREEEIVAILRELDVAHRVIDNAPLDIWLPMLLLSENLLERQAAHELQQRINDSFFGGLRAGRPIPYRKIYVCAKSSESAAALERLDEIPFPANPAEELPASVTSLHYMASVTSSALNSLETDRRAEHADYQLQIVGKNNELAACQGEINKLQSHIEGQDAEIARLGYDLAGREEDLLLWRRQHMMLESHVHSLTHSKVWRLMAPLRLLRRVLRPRGLDETSLIPWNQLVRHPKVGGDTWFVTGTDGHFIVPCYLPAGWIRIRLKMTSDVIGRAELYFDRGAGSMDTDCVARTEVHGKVDRDLYFYLSRPALGVRFSPLDVPGQFRLDRLQVTPVSPPVAVLRAFAAKLGLLHQYGLMRRATGNGLGLLLRGRFREFLRKLTGALDYPKSAPHALQPQTAAMPESMAYQPVAEASARGRRNGTKKLDIVYVLRSAGLCGGVKVVLEHASRLLARGHQVRIFFLEGTLDWFRWKVPASKFSSVDALKRALAEFRGIKVATWYETAPWVAESLQAGDRGYYLIQDVEECYCTTEEDAANALNTYRLGLKPITEGLWVRSQLKDRFSLDSVFVSIGLDFDLFQPHLIMRDPQTILTQARTWSGGGEVGAKLKGWETAKSTILRCHELNPRTRLRTFSIEEKQQFPPALEHAHFRGPTDEQLAELYSHAGMYLLTSTHEGFGLTAAEAMACGCPVVATRAHGNEEFCIDGVTALTAPADDAEQLAQNCARLQSDPIFARELGQNGRSFILNYTWERVIDRLEREFLDINGPEVIIETPRALRKEAGTDDGLAVMEKEFRQPDHSAADEEVTPGTVRGLAHEYPELGLPRRAAVDCTIVIPAINDSRLVTQCVSSCRQFLSPDDSVQFIVVDDGTRDPFILSELRRASEELDFELLLNHQNLGFSASVNHGLRNAQGRYVVLCNNDIVFFQPWLEALRKAFEGDPRLGIVGAKLLYPDGTLQHAGVDKVPGQLRWHHAFGNKPGEHPPANQSRYAWSVTGALYAIRRETLRQLGGLSTAYSTAYEDLDYSLHAWSNGIRVGYCADVVAYHVEGGTRGATERIKSEKPLWAERERAGGKYFERKWAFLRHVENYQALLSLADRPSIMLPSQEASTALVGS